MLLEIAIASGKGGVGKSTVASTLALYLHRAGYRIVAADADADAPNLHLIYGLTSWEHEEEYMDSWIAEIDYSRCTNCGVCAEVCSYEAIRLSKGKYIINKIICEGCLTCSLACPEKAIERKKTSSGKIRWGKTAYGFPLVSASLYPGRPNSGKLVTQVKNIARGLSGKEGVLIVDSAAGIGCQVISSLAGANAAILVVEPTPASLSDLKRVHAVAKQFLLPSALVINKYDINPDYVDKILNYAKRENIDVLGYIPYDDNVPKAMAQMKPLVELYPETPAAKALLNTASRVRERVIESWRQWFSKHRPKKPSPYKPIILKPGT